MNKLTKATKKIQTGVCLTMSQRMDLEKLKMRGHIKSISDGIRIAIVEWLRKAEQQEILLKDKNQLKITDWRKKEL